MKTLSVVKKDMEFNKSLSSLIEALKNIAVSQYHSLEEKLKKQQSALPFIETFFESMDFDKINHPFVRPKNNSQVVVAITSDNGLLGGLNMQVVNAALYHLQQIPGRFVVIGERGKFYARESGIPFVVFGGIKDEDRRAQAMQLRDYVIDKMLEDSTGCLKIVYPKPLSFTVQRAETISFLPYTAPVSADNTTGKHLNMIMESSPADIIEYLTYLRMGQMFYEIFGLSRLSEFAARYVHLEESLQKLKEMDNKLRLEYFRIRHELIDRNMRELFSVRLLYAGK